MRKLFLIRHAQPQFIPDIPTHLWPLTLEGREAALHLAQRLAMDDVSLIYASPEPKAHETAHIIAQYLNLSLETIPDLREHERGDTPFLDQDTWEATLATFFSRPTELVFGTETALQAFQRFSAAIEKIVTSNPDRNLAMVTHGTVITLFVASHNPQIDALAFWHLLKLPDLVVLSLPEFKLANAT